MNVKTAETIGPKFCVGPHSTPGKVNGWSKLQKIVSKSFLFLYYFLYKEKMLTDRVTINVKIVDGRKA